MFRVFVNDKASLTRHLLQADANALKVTKNGLGLEFANAELMKSQEGKQVNALLQHKDPAIRRFAILHFALAILEKRVSRFSLHHIVQEFIDNDKQTFSLNDQSPDFELLLNEENAALLKLIFRQLSIDRINLNLNFNQLANADTIKILADIIAASNAPLIQWELAKIPSSIQDESIRQIQGSTPSAAVYFPPDVKEMVGFARKFRALVSMPTLVSVDFHHIENMDRSYIDVFSLLEQSSVTQLGLGMLHTFLQSRANNAFVLPVLAGIVKNKIKELDLREDFRGNQTPTTTIDAAMAKILFEAIGASSLEALLLDVDFKRTTVNKKVWLMLRAALAKCQHLTSLTITDMTRDEHSASIADFNVVLRELPSLRLKELFLIGGFIRLLGQDDLKKIMGIFNNRHLKKLEFGHRLWSKDQWIIFFNALEKSQLEYLTIPCFGDLVHGVPGQAGFHQQELWERFCEVISFSKLRMVNILDENDLLELTLNEADCQSLAAAMHRNVYLADIQINNKRLPDIPKFASIRAALKLNIELDDLCLRLEYFSFTQTEGMNKNQVVAALAKDEKRVADLADAAFALFKRWEAEDVHYNYSSLATFTALNDMLQPAITKFLKIILYAHQWRVEPLLLLLRATNEEVKHLYGVYAYNALIASKKISYSSKLLLGVLNFHFDAAGHHIHFANEEYRHLDIALLRILKFTDDAIIAAPALTASTRLALWQYFILTKLLSSKGIEQKLKDNLEAALNPALPALIVRGEKIPEMKALWEQTLDAIDATQLDLKPYIARGFRFTIALERLCSQEEEFVEKYKAAVGQHNCRARFIEALPLCLNRYNKLMDYSPHHQSIFDKFLIAASGANIADIDDDAQRIVLLQRVLLSEWRETAKPKANRAVMFQPTGAVSSTDTIDELASENEIAEIMEMIANSDQSKYAPITNCIEAMVERRTLHETTQAERRIRDRENRR